jgi:hypothetical protein
MILGNVEIFIIKIDPSVSALRESIFGTVLPILSHLFRLHYGSCAKARLLEGIVARCEAHYQMPSLA